jgi:signal transduction histidine kinase
MQANQLVSHRIRILVVDDDEDDYVLVRDTLDAISLIDFETEWASSYEMGVRALASNTYDLCLLDYHLGHKSGLDLLRETSGLGSRTPVILLTGQGSYQIDLQAMQEGAVFYLDKKNLYPDELERIVRYSIERAQTLRTLRLANDELELRVAERTRQLEAMNLQLERALAQEKELNSLRARLVTTVSHEFRTPLSVILSSAELLRRYSPRMTDEQRQSHLEEIIHQVDWLTRLLSDMFTLRKADSGLLENKLEEIDLVAYCQSVIDSVTPFLSQGQQLFLVVQGQPTAAFMDRSLLQAVLSNLLDNAIKFSREDGIIVLTLIFEGDQIVITIRDEGMGIAEADLPHVFEPFMRGRNAEHIKGAGMGLAIVKNTVEVMGGLVEIRSEVDAGTTVSVQLPLLHVL